MEATVITNQVHIASEAVPAFAYDIGCRVLASQLKSALADPGLHAEYEAWKERRK